jgi:queuosine precursor transporter
MFERDLTLKETRADHEWCPKYFDVVACLYICALFLTWVLASKMFVVGGLILNAGILAYPLTGVFGDSLTEIYGFSRTRRLIWMGFICGLIFLFFTQIAVALPTPLDFRLQEAFAAVHGQLPRIVIASYTAYLCCEFTNSFIMSRMKVWSKANNFPLRALVSTAVAQLVDSVVFFIGAFAGTMPNSVVFQLIVSGWIIKTIYEFILLPVTTVAVKKIKFLEGIEHFDCGELSVLKF